MNSILGIWKTRIEEYVKETRSYLKYMLNDHLVIVMIFSSLEARAGTANG